MKRRPEINTRNVPKVRKSSVEYLDGVRRCVEIKDVLREKKVMFADPEINFPPSNRHYANALQYQATGPSESNAPKTSEYAFFKKVKNDAGCCGSHPFLEDANCLKNYEPIDSTREITKIFKDSRYKLNSSLLFEKARPANLKLVLSPHANMTKNQEGNSLVEGSHNDIRSQVPVENVKPLHRSLLFSPPGDVLNNSGTEYMDGEVFAGKRKRLQQWLADTLLLEADQLYSKGLDLVSLLLNRLFPDNDENNYYRVTKPTRTRVDTKNSPYTFPDSVTFNKEVHWMHNIDNVEADHEWYLDNSVNSSREKIPLKWDSEGFGTPAMSYPAKNPFQYENETFGFEYSDYGRASSSITLRDPYINTNFGKYQSSSPTCIEELKGCQDLGECAIRKASYTLLLGWDFDNLKDEGHLSISPLNMKHLQSPTLADSGDGRLPNVDDSFDASELYSYLGSQDAGRFLQSKCIVSELKPFPLFLSYTPRYFNFGEGNISSEGNSSICAHDNSWLFRKIFSKMHHPNMEEIFIHSGIGFDLGSKCLSKIDSLGELSSSIFDGFQHSRREGSCSNLLNRGDQEDDFCSLNHRQTITYSAKDALDSRAYSSINSQIPLDRGMVQPLPLDSSCWLRSKDVYCNDDNDDNDDDRKGNSHGQASLSHLKKLMS